MDRGRACHMKGARTGICLLVVNHVFSLSLRCGIVNSTRASHAALPSRAMWRTRDFYFYSTAVSFKLQATTQTYTT